MGPRTWSPVLGVALLAGAPAAAHAHAGGRGFILLLPTHLYIVGGALVVLASFVVISLLPARRFAGLAGAGRRLGTVGAPGVGPSLASLLLVLFLVGAGHWGSRDPLANPLPLFVWTVWWIGFTALHALLGNLWVRLNPWSGLYRVAVRLLGPPRWREEPPLRYPAAAGYWPAVAAFLAFAWFELIHPAPVDPAVLATAVSVYLALGFLGMLLFGERAWLQYGEAFSVFFRVISWLSPLGVERPGGRCRDCTLECRAAPNCLNCAGCLAGGGPRDLVLRVPGLNLLAVRPLGPSGVAFVLLALSSVSFDGLSKTFRWLGWMGVNPLEYPGRTALVGQNTAGLLGLFALLALAYGAAVLLAGALGGTRGAPRDTVGTFVLAIVPIAFGYHFAHYLPAFMVEVQYAARAASDPLGLGWDLFGIGGGAVRTLFSDPFWIYTVWYAQMLIIVAAHVGAIWVGHLFALRQAASAGAAVVSQVPMTLLMVGYTLFGLWLLSAPAVG
jgi:hypothetical protein